MYDPIIVYFDFPSVHTYLALRPLGETAARHGRELDWRPVSLFDVWKHHDYMPVGNPKAKGRYVKRDFMRTAELLGLPLQPPASFPMGDVSAARHLIWHLREKDTALANRLAVRLMSAHWGEARDVAEADDLAALAEEAGVPAEEVAAAAGDSAAAAACAAATKAAAEDGVFGAPWMVADGEPFWGHDRVPYLDLWLARRG